MTHIIIQIKFNYINVKLMKQIKEFFQYTLCSLVHQIDPEFYCYIECDTNVIEDVLAYKEQAHFKDERFIFIKNIVEQRNHMLQLHMNATDHIQFVHVSSIQIYPNHLIQFIRKQPSTDCLQMIKSKILYNTTNQKLYYAKKEAISSFVYPCSVDEYLRLYFLYAPIHYDMICQEDISMPHEDLNIESITHYSSLNNSMIVKPLNENEQMYIKDTFHMMC